MQFLRKALFSAPNSFFFLASLRQAVRWACLAAASFGAAMDAGEGAGAWVAAPSVPAD